MYNIDFLTKVSIFIQIVESEIKLKHRPKIKLPDQITLVGGKFYGIWNCETYKGRFYHKISIALGMIESDELLFATVAHEYVHAWQYELGLSCDHDNESFLLWVEYFKLLYKVEL